MLFDQHHWNHFFTCDFVAGFFQVIQQHPEKDYCDWYDRPKDCPVYPMFFHLKIFILDKDVFFLDSGGFNQESDNIKTMGKSIKNVIFAAKSIFAFYVFII